MAKKIATVFLFGFFFVSHASFYDKDKEEIDKNKRDILARMSNSEGPEENEDTTIHERGSKLIKEIRAQLECVLEQIEETQFQVNKALEQHGKGEKKT